MARKLLNYLTGYVTLRIKGDQPERLINMASSRGIFFWNVAKRDKDLRVTVRVGTIRPLRHLAGSDYELEVEEKGGIPFWRQQIQNRRMLFAGALIFVFLMYFLSSIAWRTEVIGNKKVPAATILASANRRGLHQGAFKWNFNKTEVEKGLLIDIPLLSYAEVDVSGVRVTIRVVEKTLPDDQITGPCHVVARKDGVIAEMLVLEGQPMVRVGDAVAAGDILISGVVFPSFEAGSMPMPPYTVHARGQVKARVWYEGYGEWPLVASVWRETGRRARVISLVYQGREKTLLTLGHQIEERRKTSSRVIRLPGLRNCALHVYSVLEMTRVRQTYSEDEALRRAKEIAMAQIKTTLSGSEQIVNTRWETVSAPAEPLVRIRAIVEAVEEVGRPEPLRVEQEPN